MKGYTLRRKIKLRGKERLAGSTLYENEVSEHQLRWLQSQGVIAGPIVTRATVLPALVQPRKWPAPCCGRR